LSFSYWLSSISLQVGGSLPGAGLTSFPLFPTVLCALDRAFLRGSTSGHEAWSPPFLTNPSSSSNSSLWPCASLVLCSFFPPFFVPSLTVWVPSPVCLGNFAPPPLVASMSQFALLPFRFFAHQFHFLVILLSFSYVVISKPPRHFQYPLVPRFP